MSEIPKLKKYNLGYPGFSNMEKLHTREEYIEHYVSDFYCPDNGNNIEDTKKIAIDILETCESIYIDLDNLKEVNAFWDKYKDNPVLFCHNYPEYTTFCLDNKFVYRNCIKLFRVKNIYYRDRWYSWLHDLLYKV